ncbi:glycosyltransferase [Flavobacterium psychrotolerans]|uniref:Glycosyltransferase family 1 protein n=1 Tax=Flavobacterium psychrotolerans TaxID=2169410 RepID=A0A2U1JPI9_9FLAO|nr:glycosyltransferase [Flavobacterium psychrotolerans]PWA06869.1 glycosyltransferase family 1 protein [Flavobacterium psychrotolerans]
MTKIKIVHILHSIGGVDVSLRLILENIDSSEFENIIIHGNSDTMNPFYDKSLNPIKEYKLPISREISIIDDFISIVKAYRIIRKEKPNLIHAHSAKGGVIGRSIGTLTGIKVLYTPQAFSFLSTSNKIKRNVFLYIEKLFSKGNSLLLASSMSELNRGLKEVGFNQNKVLLFNNAIEPIKEISKLSIEKTWPDNYICTVGRPSYQKNIEMMVRVLYEVKKVREIYLVIMGVGPVSGQLESVKKLIKELDLSENITLLDWTTRKDVHSIISKSQLYISTARYEGLPYSVIESLALAIPCVVSNCDGNRDLIIDDYNGYVIKEDHDIIDFSNKIINLLKNKNVFDKFSANAKKTFEQHFNILEKIKDLESIYSAQKNKFYN